ncbi:TPA: hypothetical protein QIX85_000299 [Serratia marcescens]|nr:hypothetical protein [Serratia marcescens]
MTENNKLSELSKPVDRFTFEPLAERWHHIKHGEKQNLEGGPWELKKLYSQEYVSALDKVTQFWIGESAGWKKRAEDAEKRIAELEQVPTIKHVRSVEEALIFATDRVSELEAKLATPVRLPKTNGYWDEQEKAFEDAITLAKRAIWRAGFKVEGDE